MFNNLFEKLNNKLIPDNEKEIIRLLNVTLCQNDIVVIKSPNGGVYLVEDKEKNVVLLIDSINNLFEVKTESQVLTFNLSSNSISDMFNKIKKYNENRFLKLYEDIKEKKYNINDYIIKEVLDDKS